MRTAPSPSWSHPVGTVVVVAWTVSRALEVVNAAILAGGSPAPNGGAARTR